MNTAEAAVEAQIRQHFSGEALEKKLAEWRAMRDPARQQAVQAPLSQLLIDTLKTYASECEQKGTPLTPPDLTIVLMNLIVSHICSTRDKRLPARVVIGEMGNVFVRKLAKEYQDCVRDEAQTQPGG